ncbi:cytochrome P450 [Massariosphaeria phaeospora]|uniref:Cytochrome P450 n=1 Tax=Massariosphaeria phaeospora TaxID=100035 RepID=A0A7C8MHI4_9PLEO|nr:cytochrome P450 [Massariosphaeria phaeospora]
MKRIADFAIPSLKIRKNTKNPAPANTSLEFMLDKAQTEQERDPRFLAKLQSALNAGGVHPTAILVVNTLLDLAKHPKYQEKLREEIRQKNVEVSGNWDQHAFDTLYKLDSALKESLRFNPATLTAYSRELLMDCELSSGLRLRKGQLICVPSCSKQKDENIFAEPDKYDALRSYNEDANMHRARPFKSLDEHAHRWGAGRSACPGRFMANIIVTVILVRLLDEYDFQLAPSRGRPDSTMTHEFIWLTLGARLMVKRRVKNSGIVYGTVAQI